MNNYRLTHLKQLESESIDIIREAYAQSERPVMLYSIGKDSSVMIRLAQKAFFPGKVPFPILHIDSTYKFREMIQFRDEFCNKEGLNLIVHINEEGRNAGVGPFSHGSKKHTDIMKTQALLQALNKGKYDIVFGGARRDEEKSRAKERIFSFRDSFHQRDPKSQRPELWSLYNAQINPGESVRVFPISNWTEMDVWYYIYYEKIPIVPLYFAKQRPIVRRYNSLIMVDDDRMPLEPDEQPEMMWVRFRTLGCYPLTGGVESKAATMEEIIEEMVATDISERSSRVIDFDTEASMEKKKKEGYF
jgi:sulfate adenylyltransferase subunit 2